MQLKSLCSLLIGALVATVSWLPLGIYHRFTSSGPAEPIAPALPDSPPEPSTPISAPPISPTTTTATSAEPPAPIDNWPYLSEVFVQVEEQDVWITRASATFITNVYAITTKSDEFKKNTRMRAFTLPEKHYTLDIINKWIASKTLHVFEINETLVRGFKIQNVQIDYVDYQSFREGSEGVVKNRPIDQVQYEYRGPMERSTDKTFCVIPYNPDPADKDKKLPFLKGKALMNNDQVLIGVFDHVTANKLYFMYVEMGKFINITFSKNEKLMINMNDGESANPA